MAKRGRKGRTSKAARGAHWHLVLLWKKAILIHAARTGAAELEGLNTAVAAHQSHGVAAGPGRRQ
jgi:hypothetical protein